jgi:hypothetical protein
MAFKNDVADDMAPVRHPIWPYWAPRLAPSGPRHAPRLARLALVRHPVLHQGCHNGSFRMKITVWTSARVRIYPVDAVLPADGFYRPQTR